jgi:hypothetical protein
MEITLDFQNQKLCFGRMAEIISIAYRKQHRYEKKQILRVKKEILISVQSIHQIIQQKGQPTGDFSHIFILLQIYTECKCYIC